MAFKDLPGQLFVTDTDYNDNDEVTDLPILALRDNVGDIRRQIDDATGRRRTLLFVRSDASSAAIANGTPVGWSADSAGDQGWEVTTAFHGSNGARNKPAGVGIGTITIGYYGWIQSYGDHTAVITNGDDDIADGDNIILSSTEGKVDSVAAGTAPTHTPLGIAVAADVDASNTVATFINCGPA